MNETPPTAAPGEPAIGENVTLNVCVCPAAIVSGRVATPDTENVAPLTVSPVMVTFAPTAVKVPVWDELLVPSGTEPKVKLPGLITRPAPVPDRVAGDGVFEALLLNDRLPETLPVSDGAKPTLKLTLWPEGMVTGNVTPLRRKPAPLNVSEVIVTAPLLALKLPACSALVVPRLTVPKVKLDGVIESCPVAAVIVSEMVFDITPLCVAVILLEPTPAPVARPVLLIVTAPVFDEVHEAEAVRFCVVPSVNVPVAVN